MNLKFHGIVRNGKFVPESKDLFLSWFRSYEGKKMTVIAGDYIKPRSEQENKYYWAVIVTQLSKFLGNEKEEIHDMLKGMFLKFRIYKKIHNHIVEIVGIKSTTKLSTIEFEEYVENIKRWAAMPSADGGLEFKLPDPNQIYFNR